MIFTARGNAIYEILVKQGSLWNAFNIIWTLAKILLYFSATRAVRSYKVISAMSGIVILLT